MNRIRKKLHSSRGASMMMALLLLLVAVMVAAVILAAASTAAASVRSDRAQQQAYLTVSSAAKLLRDSILSSSKYQKTVLTIDYQGYTPKEPETEQISRVPETEPFAATLNSAIETVLAGAGNTFHRTYRFTLEGYDEVTAELLFSRKEKVSDTKEVYQLTVNFVNEGAGISENNQKGHPCRMTLTMLCTSMTETTNVTVYRDVWVSGHWENAPGGNTWVEGSYQNHQFSAKQTATTFTWSDAEIRKEADA